MRLAMSTSPRPRPVTPLLTTDIIIELIDRPARPIVLIERRYQPLGWALPGGFVDVGESVPQAAVREAAEETGLTVQLTDLLGCYSDPRRDPRGHSVTLVYIATARGEPRADDDAAAAKVCAPDELPAPLAFDHATILQDYARFRLTGERPLPGPL